MDYGNIFTTSSIGGTYHNHAYNCSVQVSLNEVAHGSAEDNTPSKQITLPFRNGDILAIDQMGVEAYMGDFIAINSINFHCGTCYGCLIHGHCRADMSAENCAKDNGIWRESDEASHFVENEIGEFAYLSALDMDQDSVVTKKELETAMQALGQTPSDALVNNLMLQIDGKLDELSLLQDTSSSWAFTIFTFGLSFVSHVVQGGDPVEWIVNVVTDPCTWIFKGAGRALNTVCAAWGKFNLIKNTVMVADAAFNALVPGGGSNVYTSNGDRDTGVTLNHAVEDSIPVVEPDVYTPAETWAGGNLCFGHTHGNQDGLYKWSGWCWGCVGDPGSHTWNGQVQHGGYWCGVGERYCGKNSCVSGCGKSCDAGASSCYFGCR